MCVRASGSMIMYVEKRPHGSRRDWPQCALSALSVLLVLLEAVAKLVKQRL